MPAGTGHHAPDTLPSPPYDDAVSAIGALAIKGWASDRSAHIWLFGESIQTRITFPSLLPNICSMSLSYHLLMLFLDMWASSYCL